MWGTLQPDLWPHAPKEARPLEEPGAEELAVRKPRQHSDTEGTARVLEQGRASCDGSGRSPKTLLLFSWDEKWACDCEQLPAGIPAPVTGGPSHLAPVGGRGKGSNKLHGQVVQNPRHPELD